MPFFDYSETKRELVDNIEIQWLKEEESGFTFFRLYDLLDNQRFVTLNKSLENLHQTYTQSFLDCHDLFDDSKSGVEELRATINYISGDLLSFTVVSSSFCKGMATINIEEESNLYDLNTLESLALRDVLRIDFSPDLDAQVNEKLDSLNMLSLKAIRDLVFLTQGWKIQEPLDKGACNYYDPNIWATSVWRYTKKGIELTPSFPTVSQVVCRRPFLIPYAHLLRFKKKTFLHSLDWN